MRSLSTPRAMVVDLGACEGSLSDSARSKIISVLKDLPKLRFYISGNACVSRKYLFHVLRGFFPRASLISLIKEGYVEEL